MKTGHLAFLMVVVAAGCPSASWAQNDPAQTPENAARFLMHVLPGTVAAWDGPDVARDVVLRSANRRYSEECRTDFNVFDRDRQTGRLTENQLQLSWATVRQVRQEGGNVLVIDQNGTRTFPLLAEAMAARVAYAMEFLRLHCDPAADTGF